MSAAPLGRTIPLQMVNPPLPLPAWTRVFEETLLRLYPKTDVGLAAAVAHHQYSVDKALDPVRAAELYALSEGQPRSPD